MIFKLTDITKFICDYSDEYDDVLEFSYVPSNMSFRMKLFQMEVLNPKYDKSNADFVNDVGKERLAILTT